MRLVHYTCFIFDTVCRAWHMALYAVHTSIFYDDVIFTRYPGTLYPRIPMLSQAHNVCNSSRGATLSIPFSCTGTFISSSVTSITGTCTVDIIMLTPPLCSIVSVWFLLAILTHQFATFCGLELLRTQLLSADVTATYSVASVSGCKSQLTACMAQ